MRREQDEFKLSVHLSPQAEEVKPGLSASAVLNTPAAGASLPINSILEAGHQRQSAKKPEGCETFEASPS
jgi:hypothetical protein